MFYLQLFDAKRLVLVKKQYSDYIEQIECDFMKYKNKLNIKEHTKQLINVLGQVCKTFYKADLKEKQINDETDKAIFPIRHFINNRKERQVLFELKSFYEDCTNTSDLTQKVLQNIKERKQFQQSFSSAISFQYLQQQQKDQLTSSSLHLHDLRPKIEYRIMKTKYLQKYFEFKFDKAFDIPEMKSVHLLENLFTHLYSDMKNVSVENSTMFVRNAEILNNLFIWNPKYMKQVLNDFLEEKDLGEEFFNILWS